MSHRLTFFTLPTARAALVVLGGGCLCFLFVFGSCVLHVQEASF